VVKVGVGLVFSIASLEPEDQLGGLASGRLVLRDVVAGKVKERSHDPSLRIVSSALGSIRSTL
jgi:hypothetical protein